MPSFRLTTTPRWKGNSLCIPVHLSLQLSHTLIDLNHHNRYSWFTARATNVGTLPSLFNSAPGSLTEVGTLYNSAGDSLPLPTSPSPSPSQALSPSVGSSNAPSPSSQVASPSPSLSGSSPTAASPTPSLSGSSPKHEPSPGKSSASGLVHPLALIRSLLFA